MKKQKYYIPNQASSERQVQSIKFLRKSIESNQFSQFVGWTKIDPLQAFVNSKKKIKSYSSFTYLSLGVPLSLKSELFYSLLQIAGNLSVIEEFTNDSRIIEDLIVNRKYHEAFEKLDTIDSKFGLSLWSLDLKLTLSHLMDKEFGEFNNLTDFQKRISKLAKKGLIANYSFHKKIALEYDANTTNIQQSILSRLKRYNVTDDFYNYLAYRLANIYPNSFDEASHILFNENRASIIDIFTTLRDLIFYYGDELEVICLELLDLEILSATMDVEKFKALIVGNFECKIFNDSDIVHFTNAIVSNNDPTIGETINRSQLKLARTGIGCYYMYLSRYISDVLPGYIPNRHANSRTQSALSIFSRIKFETADDEYLRQLEVALFSRSDEERAFILSLDYFKDSIASYKYIVCNEINQRNSKVAANLIAKYALVKKLLVVYLPIHKFTSDLETELDDRKVGTLESLITCHLEYKNRPSKKSYARVQEELDCFLSNENLAYPHQLDIYKYPTEYSEYYFKEICDLNIIDYWYMLDTNEKLFDERIKSLKRLVELNPLLAKEIQNEIIIFSTRSQSREILNSLNRSKLRIDLKIFTDILSPKIELDYTRMLSKIDSKIIEQAEKKLLDVIKNRKLDSEFGKPLDDDVYSLIDYLVLTVAREYLENSQVGLDHSLGTRIRHNIFLDEISSIFKEKNLYLKKNDINRTNILQAWAPAIEDSDQILAAELTRFTLELNKIVNDFKDKYIHIKSDKHKDGVFNIDVNQNISATIVGLLTKDQKFSEFIAICINTLNNGELHKKVARMRELIDIELEPQIQQRIATLKKRMPVKNNSELDIIFRDVETGFNQSIAEVRRWFSLESSITQRAKYTAEDSFNTAKEILKNIDIEPSEGMTLVFPDIGYTHQVHETVVYSLVILIDNSIKYASSSESNLRITHEDAFINVEFSSSLSDAAARKKLDDHWQELVKFKNDDEISRFLEHESGSGLARIFSSIRYSENSSFDYVWADGMAKFTLKIALSFVDDLIDLLEVSS